MERKKENSLSNPLWITSNICEPVWIKMESGQWLNIKHDGIWQIRDSMRWQNVWNFGIFVCMCIIAYKI